MGNQINPITYKITKEITSVTFSIQRNDELQLYVNEIHNYNIITDKKKKKTYKNMSACTSEKSQLNGNMRVKIYINGIGVRFLCCINNVKKILFAVTYDS